VKRGKKPAAISNPEERGKGKKPFSSRKKGRKKL